MSKITNFFTPGTNSDAGRRSKVSSNSDNDNKDEDDEPPAKRSLKSTSSEATEERCASSKKSSVSSEDVYRIINDVFTEHQKKVLHHYHRCRERNCSLVSKAVDMWKAAKKRRKLPHHRPSTQPQASSETEVATPTTVVQDIGTQTDVTSTTELQNIREEYEEALHVLHLDDMVEEELDSLEAFAKSMETGDSGDSGVDE